MGRQEDAHEYLVGLLDAMHEGVLAGVHPRPPRETAETSFIYRIFAGRLRSQVWQGAMVKRQGSDGAGRRILLCYHAALRPMPAGCASRLSLRLADHPQAEAGREGTRVHHLLDMQETLKHCGGVVGRWQSVREQGGRGGAGEVLRVRIREQHAGELSVPEPGGYARGQPGTRAAALHLLRDAGP